MRGGVSYISRRHSQANNEYYNIMIQNKNQNLSFNWMKIIYMLLLCLNFFQPVETKGLILKILT